MHKHNHYLLTTAIVLFFIMFIYSGFDKIKNFDKKVEVLTKKINSSETIAIFGIICVILLEIVGSLYLIWYTLTKKYGEKNTIYYLALTIVYLFLIFIVVVTMIYHPPTKSMIPFLSNLTTFAGVLLILYVIQLS